jgi:hypothetical protein
MRETHRQAVAYHVPFQGSPGLVTSLQGMFIMKGLDEKAIGTV